MLAEKQAAEDATRVAEAAVVAAQASGDANALAAAQEAKEAAEAKACEAAVQVKKNLARKLAQTLEKLDKSTNKELRRIRTKLMVLRRIVHWIAIPMIPRALETWRHKLCNSVNQ